MNRNLDELSPDELFSIAIMLDYEDLLRFCSTSKRINNIICRQPKFWRNKYQKDFPNSVFEPSRENYKILHQLKIKAKNILNKYHLFLIDSSSENMNTLIEEMKTLKDYYPFVEYILNNLKNYPFAGRLFTLSHIIDNSDKKLRERVMFPVMGIRQYLEEFGIDWSTIQ